MYIFFKEWCGKIEKKPAEQTITDFCRNIAAFFDGNIFQDAKGLAQNGKTAKGNQHTGGGKPKGEGVRSLAKEKGSVGHFQKTTQDSCEKLSGEGEEGKALSKKRKDARLLKGFHKNTKENDIAADLCDGIHRIGNGLGEALRDGGRWAFSVSNGLIEGVKRIETAKQNSCCCRTEKTAQ